MFKNLFEVKRKEKEIQVGLKVTKLEKVTKILLPDDNISLQKDDRIIITSLEDSRIILTKVVEGIPEEIAKKSFSYNITDNSVNSQVLAEKLKDIFIIDDEEFTLNTEVVIIEGYECLVLTKAVETITLDETNTTEVFNTEEVVEEELEEVVVEADTSFL